MIIYKNTIKGFIEDCNLQIISTLIINQLKEKRGININRNSKEAKSYSTLIEVSKIFDGCIDKENQYILLEYVIRDSNKRIDLIILGSDKINKNLAIIELKGWSKVNLYKETNLLDPNVSYGPCNHPGYEALDYYTILVNCYDNINHFNLIPIAYLPNYNYQKDNVLKNKIFSNILEKCYVYCNNDSYELKNIINSKFNSRIEIEDLNRLENLEYKPSLKFLEHIKNEWSSIRLIGSQNIAYERFWDIYKENNEKILYIISGGAGSGKTVIAFKIMMKLRLLSHQSYLMIPGPEFRSAIVNNYGDKIAASFIKGANSSLKGDFVIVDEAHKATGKDNAHTFYKKIFNNISKGIIALIDDNQVINKKGITKNELIELALNNGVKKENIVILNLTEQFRNAGDVSYTNWLKRLIFKEDNNQEIFINDFFDFRILDHHDFNEIYEKMYDKYNVRMVSFWTNTWNTNKLEPTVFIGDRGYIWNPNWQWLLKFKSNGNKPTKEIIKLCETLNFNTDKKGKEFIGYFNTVQGTEFDYIFVHIPKLFFLNDKNEIDVNLSELCLSEMSTQIWSTSRIKDNYEKRKKEKLNKLYFLNRLFINLTRGTVGAYVYFEDKKLEEYFKSKYINKRK